MKRGEFGLPAAALVAVLALLGVQLALGGADFVPTAKADPCVERSLPAIQGADLDAVTQAVVFGGVQDAACDLGITREQLLLALPSEADRTALATSLGKTDDELLAAIQNGMVKTVDELDQAGRIPPASSLVETYAGQLGLPALAQQALEQLPANLVDGFLPTASVLRRAISSLDLGELLAASSEPEDLEPAIRQAITDAAIAEVREQLAERLPGPLKGLISP